MQKGFILKNIWMIGKNMEDITDADYVHAKRVCIVEYHDFYVQSDTLLLADVFENFQNMS